MHEAGAAVVAAQLLAIYKEPVRFRPRLTHGREPFGGGLLAFKFAQGKFPHALMRDLSAQERERVRQAAVFFIRQICLWDGATHYQLLCVAPDARREAIKEHYHCLMALIHPDRQDDSSQHWPSGCAQRVNQAYAVLSDDALRREFDSGLQKATSGSATLEESVAQHSPSAAVHAPVRDKSAAARIRFRRPVLLVSAVLATLFFLQIWWVSDVPREYSVLSNAAPFDLSTRWVRDAFSSAERPKFMGASPSSSTNVQARTGEAAEGASMPFLAPLWKALSDRVVESKPATEPVPASASVANYEPRKVESSPAEQMKLESQLPVEGRAARLPSAVAQSASSVSSHISQATVKRSPLESSISSTDMETLVARLVTYYEAGDLDRLLGLYDAGSIGVWQAIRIRHDFQEFFRATKMRRLRLQQVSWETSAQTGRARGKATLVVEYHDDPGKVERNVELEADVTQRDGRLMITRLSLFPHGR